MQACILTCFASVCLFAAACTSAFYRRACEYIRFFRDVEAHKNAHARVHTALWEEEKRQNKKIERALLQGTADNLAQWCKL